MSAKGYMLINVGRGKSIVLHGGPFKEKPAGFQGLCLLENEVTHKDGTKNIWLPIRDFSIPSAEAAIKAGTLAICHALEHRPVYIGCMGGIGRTGLMMGCIAAMLGSDDPVFAVRSTYMAKAIETPEQEAFVTGREFKAVRKHVKWLATSAKARSLYFFANGGDF